MFFMEACGLQTLAFATKWLPEAGAFEERMSFLGIVGMGETRADRIGLLMTLANLAHHPESVPINELVQVPGTPLADGETLDPFEFVRTVAVARLMMPDSAVRLSAGRTEMSDELQALCFTAGADSIFYGEKLLTTDNPEGNTDRELLDRIGLRAGLSES